MNVLLNHWQRILYIILCIAGLLAYVFIFALKPSGAKIPFTLVCFLLAPMAFFTGTIFYNLFKMFDKTAAVANYIQLATGVVATVLLFIGVDAVYKETGLADFVKRSNSPIDPGFDAMSVWYSQALLSIAYIGHLIVFAFMPLVKGISKTLAVTPMFTKIAPTPVPTPAPAIEEPVKRTRKPRTPKVTE